MSKGRSKSNTHAYIPESKERDVYSYYSRSLKRELVRAQEEIKRIQSVPLVIGQFMEAIDQKWVSSCFMTHHLQFSDYRFS